VEGGERSKEWGDVVDQSLLVNIELERGAKIVEALDQAKLKLDVAVWAFLEEFRDWRLVIASRELDKLGSGAYGTVLDALREAGISVEERPSMLILRMSDRTIKDLRRLFGKAKSVEGMRLGGQLFGDRFFIEGFAYRIR
jgi:hypothetical protein